MVNTSSHPIVVDGVRLDTLAWNIEKVNRAVAARRSRNVEVPGRDGVIPSLDDDLEETRLGLEMFVMGTDADGAVPGGNRRTLLWQNLDELVHLFGKRHALLDLQEAVGNGTVWRRAWAKVEDSLEPDVNTPGTSGRFSVSLVLPYGVWEDVDAQTWTQAAPVTAAPVVALDGGTDRITDAILAVEGPITNPRITDASTGAWVQLNAALGDADVWRVNCDTWATRVGNLSVDSSDTEGIDQTAVTVTGGPVAASALPLTPVRTGGLRRVLVSLTGTSGVVNGNTRLTVKARRKYAL